MGPYGKCDIIKPSGIPLVSLTTTISLKSALRHASTNSSIRRLPRLIDCEFGSKILISLFEKVMFGVVNRNKMSGTGKESRMRDEKNNVLGELF